MTHKKHRVRGLREAVAFAAVFLITFLAAGMIYFLVALRPGAQELGITFSSKYAEDLGMNPVDAFTTMITDLGVRDVRFSVYWADIEKEQGVWDFSSLDTYMGIAAEHNVDITLAIGMKVPRWPECYIPSYVDTSSDAQLDASLYRYMQALVGHAKMYSALTDWQVENEPLFPFGDCPGSSLTRLKNEVSLVRGLDPAHPVMLTVSGEQEPWLDIASMADSIGVSMYRFAYNNVLGPILFPHQPSYYRIHAMITRLFAKEVIVSELQMEPWFTGGPQDISSIAVPFTAKDFSEHLNFAKQTGIRKVLLWGSEWWYYQKIHGDETLWNAARRAFSTTQ